ncbi:hypothetical protein AAMO2058_000510500 [Amorphochlora amoebiformis]
MGDKKSVIGQLECYLTGQSFPVHLQFAYAKAARGQGASVISDAILEDTILGVHQLFPDSLQKDIPEPNSEFVQTALKPYSKKRPKSGCWKVEDITELLQVVLISLAASVDKFRDIGGKVVDARTL